jgi:hypothetical protein
LRWRRYVSRAPRGLCYFFFVSIHQHTLHLGIGGGTYHERRACFPPPSPTHTPHGHRWPHIFIIFFLIFPRKGPFVCVLCVLSAVAHASHKCTHTHVHTHSYTASDTYTHAHTQLHTRSSVHAVTHKCTHTSAHARACTFTNPFVYIHEYLYLQAPKKKRWECIFVNNTNICSCTRARVAAGT